MAALEQCVEIPYEEQEGKIYLVSQFSYLVTKPGSHLVPVEKTFSCLPCVQRILTVDPKK